MRISQYLNTTKKEVDAKKFNIFFGFSLGNKYFTPEHVRSYLLWAIEVTKDKVAVLIPDKLQAVNYEVKSGYPPRRAHAVALRKGIEIEQMVKGVIDESHIPESKIKIIHWEDIEDETYSENLKVIYTAFEKNKKFREAVVRMVRETPHLEALALSDFQYEKLAKYILDELPILVSGFNKDGVQYDLFPYPGFAKLDYLALDLQEGTSFPEITTQLKIENKVRLINAFAD